MEEDNILLYVGLGMSAVGLAVTFVGRKQGAREAGSQGAREAAECGVMISLTLGTRNHYNHHSY